MAPMNSAEIRSTYLDFFRKRGHTVHPSASLVPDDDPTLLFTGAGMNQFKDMFLGRGTLGFKRATTTQKCLRLPDLDNVGRTPSHHTFFEMLGNFSFGDYFKAEAIEWADELLRTGYGLDKKRLGITVYRDDDEAAAAWKRIGYAADRIWRFGEKDNYWPSEAPSKGPNGPCGPCSEIYFDWGPRPDCPKGSACDPSCGCGRWLEIWNLVFTQFDRRDGGELKPLPQRNIDTGMGLERLVRVLQGKSTNFETDLFLPILARLAQLCGKGYGEEPRRDRPMRRIADHIRACVFAIADGVVPSNERQGYVVRKILRRALADGLDALGIAGPFLAELAPAVIAVPGMAEVFPEIRRLEGKIIAVVAEEEKKFFETYSKGRAKLAEAIEKAKASGAKRFDGRVAFYLWDTAGFPADLTQRIVEEQGLAFDEPGFEVAMEEQRARSRAGSAMQGDIFAGGPLKDLKRELPATRFTGYDATTQEATLAAILRGNERVKTATEGDDVALLFAATPFYAEGGGQVGDRGEFTSDSFRVRIRDVTKQEGFHLHHGTVVAGSVSEGQKGRLDVDPAHRAPTRRNHTATHLLHWALRRVLGHSVEQKGSLVDAERLRFDFSWQGAVPAEKLREVERLVNEQTVANLEVTKTERAFDEAVKAGAIALFGEKYGERVRVVAVEDAVDERRSVELCGGTHVVRTGDIGAFKIVSEVGIAAGVRRIEAVTGLKAIDLFQNRDELARATAAALRAPVDEIPARIAALQDEVKRLRKELEKSSRASAGGELDAILAREEKVGPLRLYAVQLDATGEQLLALADRLKQKPLGGSVVVLVGKEADKAPIVVACDREAQTKGLRAGDLCKLVAGELGGGGGGNPALGRGQGRSDRPVAAALAKAKAEVVARVAG
jgi:alanyl-tRNA synthetase